MPLTELVIKNTKPKSKAFKLYDTKGLYLLITPSGGKYWRIKYRFADKEKTHAIGVYPDVSLKEVRELHEEVRIKLRKGIDPAAERKKQKLEMRFNHANTFKDVALEWLRKQQGRWTKKHLAATGRRIEQNLFPIIGNCPIAELKPAHVVTVLQKLDDKGVTDLAHRMKYTIGQVLRYAVATQRADRDFTRDLKGVIKPVIKQNHTHLKPSELPEFLKALELYDGEPQTVIATKLLLHTLVRTGELRGAKWSEFDFDKAEWIIPAERMKMRTTHIIPLSTQVIALLERQKAFSADSNFVFPGRSNLQKCMSENTILGCIKRIGFQERTTGHGFRSVGSTVLYESGYSEDWVERQLAHINRNKVRGAYDHSKFLTQRREMMNWWSDYIVQSIAAE